MGRITNQDVQAYGPELINMTQRAAIDALSPELEDVRRRQAEIAQREQHLQNKMVFDALDAAMPDWRTINNSDVFKAWLSQQETLSGKVAWDLLLESFNRGDVPRILRFFSDFRAIGQAPTAQAPAAGRQPRPQTPAPQNVAAATAALTKLYEDSRKGRWNGKDAEKAAEERRLHAIIHGRR